MAFVSVTRLRLRHWRFLPGFALHAIRAMGQVKRAQGFHSGSVLSDRRLTFWTLTGWDDAESMRAYMMAGDHRSAMPRLVEWCDEASVVHWDQPEQALPTWAEADRRMRGDGRPSKVRHPSPAHPTLAYAPPRLTAANAIRPQRRAA